MPRPTVQDGRSRDDLRLSPEPGLEPAAGQMVRTAGALRPKAGRRAETRSSPSMQAPRSPATRVGIKRRLLEKRSRARRQSRTGHGRTRREGGPPSPPAHPPPRPSLLPKKPRRTEAEAKNVHRGSHRAADPGALFSRIGRACARAFATILLRRRTTRPGPPSKRPATRHPLRAPGRSASLGRRRLRGRDREPELDGGRRAEDV